MEESKLIKYQNATMDWAFENRKMCLKESGIYENMVSLTDLMEAVRKLKSTKIRNN